MPEDTRMDGTEFRASLDSYSGPLDLLLYLIKKEEIDVFDIPLSRVIDQYRGYLELLQEIDPNVCGEFIVMAAHLIEIKSKLLLPREVLADEDEEYEDPRLELVQQLLAFKKYKERALLLEQRFDEFRRRYHRPPMPLPRLDPDELPPIALGKVSVWDLLTLFQRIESLVGRRGPHRVTLRERPIHEYIAMVDERLTMLPNRSAPFVDLFEGVQHRQDAIGILLAVLELAKEYRLEIDRDEELDEIYVRMRDDQETRDLLNLDAQAALVDEPTETQLLAGEGAAARAEPIRSEAAEPGTSEVPEESPIDSASLESTSVPEKETDDTALPPRGLDLS